MGNQPDEQVLLDPLRARVGLAELHAQHERVVAGVALLAVEIARAGSGELDLPGAVDAVIVGRADGVFTIVGGPCVNEERQRARVHRRERPEPALRARRVEPLPRRPCLCRAGTRCRDRTAGSPPSST